MSLERWTYMGRRESETGRLVGAWLDADGAELAFALKSGHRAIGSVYEVEVTRDGDRVTAGIAGARFVEAVDGDERVAGWSAEDRAAYTADVARKGEASAKRAGAEAIRELTIAELRVRLARLPRPQRTALLANVLAELGA